jgi:hypothetical protein
VTDRDDPLVLDVLAASHAGLGDFEAAVAAAGEAIAGAERRGLSDLAAEIRERLEKYRAGEVP